MTQYRDHKTGRFVSKRTWSRSTSGRYKRERTAKPRHVVTAAKLDQVAKIEELLNQQSRSLQNLYHRHKDAAGFDFALSRSLILKVSISTAKTRKKFSVRL